MQFQSPIFLVFLVLVLLLLRVFPRATQRKGVLLVASYLFYAHWDWRFLSLIAISTAVDYAVASRLDTRRERRGLWLCLSLATNLGLLATFKYGNFVLAQLDALSGANLAAHSPLPDQIPVGISFYTFQTLSYTIDVYRRDTSACHSLLDFSLFVAFFPQLVAGPIVRSRTLIPQLRSVGAPRLDDFAIGLQRFLLGLFKKVVIADNAAMFVQVVFQDPSQFGAATLWCAAFAFSLQIYCDFSGYTDMAIGVATAIGIRLPENFRSPYLSGSITEFWRRWHISLSTWLRDYLYIPLGGSRHGAARTFYALMGTMLLGGLWHGASFTFVAWGAFHGAMLVAERAFGMRDAGSRNVLVRAARWAITLLLVTVGWVCFRAPSFNVLRVYLERMFGTWGTTDPGLGLGLLWLVAFFVLILAERLVDRFRVAEDLWPRMPAAAQGGVLALLALAISYYRAPDVPFLYFQF